MSPPTFDAAPGLLKVTVPQHALLSPDVIEWIGSLRAEGLTDTQHLALAITRTAGSVTNPMLQAWGVDASAAGQALRDLVDRALVVRTGGRRYARYQLVSSLPETLPFSLGEDITEPAGSGVEAQQDAIRQAIRAGHVTTRALSDVLGINHRTLTRRLADLVEQGVVERTRPIRSSYQSYRLTGKGKP